jgi:hypothetical protein
LAGPRAGRLEVVAEEQEAHGTMLISRRVEMEMIDVSIEEVY